MTSIGSVFAQVTSYLYPAEFARCVELFPMPRSSRSFSAYDHFLSLCYAQLTYRESLRDIVTCLCSRPQRQYRMGFRGAITRTNLAYANEKRDWRVFAAAADVLIRRAQRLYQEPASQMPELVFALDASIIHLSLNLFPWAYWARSRAGALKLHTLLSLRGNIPAWAAITDATFADMKILDEIPVEPGAFYVMDRAYLDFTRLIRLENQGAWFVVRNKAHVRFRVMESRPVDKSSGLRCDQTIVLSTPWSRKSYPKALRRVRFWDAEQGRCFVFLTNNFELAPLVVCDLYKRRWQVELFFKWVKQHLRLRNFYGRSRNAIYCQVWTAICAYVLVAIARKELGITKSLNEMLQIISVSAFEEVPLNQLFASASSRQELQETQTAPDLLNF
jgi:IS4 transposase